MAELNNPYSVRRSRPQSVTDHREIRGIKTLYHKTPMPLLATPGPGAPFSPEYRDLRRSSSGTGGWRRSEPSAPWTTVDSASMQERRDEFLALKQKEDRFLGSQNPSRMDRLHDGQKQDQGGSRPFSDRRELEGRRPEQTYSGGRWKSDAVQEHAQGAERAYLGHRDGRARRDEHVHTSDQLGRNASESMFGRNQTREDADFRAVKNRLPQERAPSREKDDCRQNYASRTQPNLTTLYIRVHDVITDIKVLGDVLTDKVNTPDCVLTPTETGIKRDDQFTYCSLTCDGKVAKMLMDLILKDREQFHPLIDCSFNDYQRYKDRSRGQNQTDAKEKLKKQVQIEIDSLSKQALLKHKQAMDEVEKKVDACKGKLGDLYTRKDTLAEIAALESKLEEQQKQKTEFTTAVDGFRAKLVAALDKDSFQEDVKFLRTMLGVECVRLNRALPMYARRQDVLSLIRQNRVSILLAETGSGKSTQVVQYLLEAGLVEQGRIVCTQPRKVAVLSLASRVAEELASEVGHRVGYKVGLREKSSPSTKIVYMTDHALLNECLKDPDLQAFSCVVVDEAHERSLYTDLLLTMIKRCLTRRQDLKVVITSATIDPQEFVNFFGSCSIMRVSGRTFPVDVVWEDSASEENDFENYVDAASEENDFENYVDAAVKKVVEIHRKAPAGDILVFLTSAAEIQKCCDMTQQRLKDRTDFECLPLHGQLQSDEQQKVFKPLERNRRKIVYATNCAETSITIDGIKYVVDTGVAKEMVYDAKKKVNSLKVTTISQSSAEQRKGRAGRTAPGTCYRLYSRPSYQGMDRISLPEILKIHLAQALLKLAELGFTPDMYDFVQSPAQDSIEAALKTLHQLGALENNMITDAGKWVVRLPFDPKLGLMTLLGHRCGLLYDSIVLASLMSTGSSLFYRGTSDTDRGKLDKVKLKFSHEGGDGLSSLQVYKAWLLVEEKKRNKWCMDNSINARSVREVKESVHDIVQILRKERKTEVTHKFSEAQDTADKLRKMIFQSNVPSLCHYLGKKAGYFAALASRQVHFHPSSTLCSLANYPQWVVYDQLLKTSRDFITGITPVDDAWLQETSTDLYGIHVEQVRQKKLDVVFAQPAGTHAFFSMVGPRYTKLHQYEEQCSSQSPDDVVIVEASREAGEVKVFSTGAAEMVEVLRRRLTEAAREAVKEVKQEVQELTIGSEESGLRVILGQGGQLTDILMPQETRKVFITRPSDDLTPARVREKFEAFGDVCYVHQFPAGRNWGFVVFRSPAEAAQAAEVTREDDSDVAELERRREVKHQAEFTAKLFWCRRPCNGTAFVNISPAYMPQFLQLRTIFISNKTVSIKMCRTNPNETLFLTGIPEVSEDLIKRSLLHESGHREDEEGIISRVHIVREKVGVTSKDDVKRLQGGLKAAFEKRLKMSSVEICVRPPNEYEIRFSAQAHFTDPIEGFAACEHLRGRLLTVSEVTVDIEPIVSATLQIQRLVYKACKEELERDMLDDVEMELKERGADNWLLCLRADDMERLVRARAFLSDVVKGDVLHCNDDPALRHLMTPAGRKMLKDAEKQTSAYVCVDERTQTLAIHGGVMACKKMHMKIDDYRDEVLSCTVEELTLRGSGRPPGLMKTLINRYDDDLDTLRQEAGLLDITINYRWHKLKLRGPPDSIACARTTVEEVSRTLMEACQQQGTGDGGEGSLDCIACLCPVDAGQLYRLEACAHPYCRDCIKQQVGLAIKDRQLPVACCQEGCDAPLSWRDFNSLSRQGHIKLPDLASSALSAYVQTHRDKACFCVTPNCPMVYRLAGEAEALTFQCPECSVRVCTACGAQAHIGVSCRMLRSSDKAKSGVDDWVKADRRNRMACPGCDCPIEKDGGCNRMVCGACRSIFCWLCRKKFPSDVACYTHLTEAHGVVFDPDDLCGAQAHDGVSCHMLRSSDKAKSGVDDWVKADRRNRMACPGCDCPIEKDGGCNRMVCGACRSIFCWLCRKKFPSDVACYTHLTEAHGVVFDPDDLCGAQAHDGVSCHMLRSSDKAKSGVDDWVKADCGNRRACPGCDCPIEKEGRCNKMVCGTCRSNFCWLCRKKFPSGVACYVHLTEKHGGVFDPDDPL